MSRTNSQVDHGPMLRLAEKLARRAAEISLGRMESARPSCKHDKSLVTTTDHEIQAMIAGAINDAYPAHAICGEETEPTPRARVAPEGARYCWVIDPLDGTRNYVANLPCFATAIAVLDEGTPVVGVVYEHNTRQMFSAVRGQGATCNEKAVRVNNLGPDSDHLLGVPSSKNELARRAVSLWHATPGYICRNLGSTAFEMGLIAAGAMSGMLGCRVKIWDIAAGTLLVQEAGGVVTDPHGQPLTPFRMEADPQQDLPMLAASATLHPILLRSIRDGISGGSDHSIK